MLVVFYGPPGSGKGTQAQILSADFGFFHFSTGDVFREEIERNTNLGMEIKNKYANGQFVSDEVVFALIRQKLEGLMGKNPNILLDGFPRTLGQCLYLNDFLSTKGVEIDYFFYFDIDQEKVLRRILGRFVCKNCGAIYNLETQPLRETGKCDFCQSLEFSYRSDDNEDVVKRRYQQFTCSTAPIVDFYQEKNKLIKIDASLGQGEINEFLINYLKLPQK